MTNKIAGWIIKDSCLEVIDRYIKSTSAIAGPKTAKEDILISLKLVKQEIEQIKTEYEE